jgi:hypothetical protein
MSTTPAALSELNPCPFCPNGGSPKFVSATEDRKPTSCVRCGQCCADGPPGLTREQAIERWNRQPDWRYKMCAECRGIGRIKDGQTCGSCAGTGGDKLNALRSRPGEGMNARYENGWYYCWLIERRDGPQTRWLGEYTWVTDANQAIWYARKSDADAVCDHDLKGANAVVCEHGFALPAVVASAEKPVCDTCGEYPHDCKGHPAPIETARGEEVKRWPFVETPGEFADRLLVALNALDGYLLGAVRNVLIENPPQLASLSAPSLEDARDAARYRWLRSEHSTIDSICKSQVISNQGARALTMLEGAELDAAIDAARGKA